MLKWKYCAEGEAAAMYHAAEMGRMDRVVHRVRTPIAYIVHVNAVLLDQFPVSAAGLLQCQGYSRCGCCALVQSDQHCSAFAEDFQVARAAQSTSRPWSNGRLFLSSQSAGPPHLSEVH